MSGNTENAFIWGDADVYITDDLAAELPADIDTEFDTAVWGLVGLLDGEAGFEEERSEDSTDHTAWGDILIRTKRRNFKLTRKFTALEENAVTYGLVWPGSTPDKIRRPKRHIFKIAFQTWDGDRSKRVMSTRYAEVASVANIKGSETELTKYEITVTIYATTDGDLFDVQGSELAGAAAPLVLSLALAPTTLAVAIGEYAPLVATATYNDSSTKVVTVLAVWTSSAITKATVDRGYVRGVAAGTSTVSAAWRTKTGTCAVTVA